MKQPQSTRHSIQEYADFLRTIRQFFYERQVLEVTTPILSHAATTDVHLDSFVCQSGVAKSRQRLFLQTSPELAMKRLLVAGSGDIFQICPVGRAEEYGTWHRPTFSMLEWYRLGFDLTALMAEVTELLQLFMPTLNQVITISYQQLYQQILAIDDVHQLSTQELRGLIKKYSLVTDANDYDRSGCFDLLMTMKIEPELQQYSALMVFDYPSCQAALAQTQQNPSGHQVAKRCELYCYGLECGNGFAELTDAVEQQRRFAEDLQHREALGLPVYPQDEKFLAALAQGLAPCAGIAIGIERLFAAVKGLASLAEVESIAWFD